MKIRTFVLGITLLCIIIGATGETDARKPDFIREPDYVRWPANIIDVDIIGDDRGLLAFSGRRDGSSLYVEARRGERYTIRVRNNWHGRIALAISVDGRNIISGERSYNRSSESMYVLNPGQTGNFDGWRSSYSQVQRFYFTSDDDSYAGRMGDYSQIGWIKVTAFRERYYEPPVVYLKEDRMSASAKKMDEQAGTGYGEGSYSPVRTTSFEPENFAAQLVNIRYEWPDAPIKYRRDYYYVPESDSDDFTPPPPRRR
ncbi:MAG: hypothetical protein CVV42_03645 [Candidatus Riflebacteria bacterium HGW-Riflebacteria-2]|jgi:hypothetical protein|nr:MAG: hypothetical protein CVV42_03645 [Candidatus Riflebacteria bacterium HGW-Riflebacteria-2]